MRRLASLIVLGTAFTGLFLSGRTSGDDNAVKGPDAAKTGESTAATPTAGSLDVKEPPESFFDKMRPKVKDAAHKFYKKSLSVKGIMIGASAEVSDDALRRTHEIVSHMLANRPDIAEEMVKFGTRIIIIGKDQVYCDMPEYKNVPNPQFMNERVRGTGGLDVCSFGEENLLNLAADRYDDESIGVHEFSHTIDAALRRIDPEFSRRLRENFEKSTSSGLWKNTYAGSNRAEYWAETVTMYFDCERPNNWNHGPVATREQLKLYDPAEYALIRETFRLTADNDWRFKPMRKQPSVISPPEKLKLDPFYVKLTYAREFPVIASNQVSDEALLKANDTVRKMFAYRHDVVKAMMEAQARLIVLGRNEKLSDLPEFRDSKGEPGFDEPRYLEFSPQRKIMVVPEENVLGLSADRFAGECMTVHVMANGLWQIAGQRPVDPDFDKRREKQQYELRVKRLDEQFDHQLQKCFDEAAGKGLWKGTPAARDRGEYWAAGVAAYFDAAGDSYAPVGAERPITSRELLERYDPGLYALVDETMAYREHVDWRFKPYTLVPQSARSVAVDAISRPAEKPVLAAPRGQVTSLAGVFKATISPHWFHDNERFWYRNDLAGGAREFILVDAAAGKRERAFDHARLAAALSEAASAHYEADRLPFDDIDFVDDANLRFKVNGVSWDCNLDGYKCTRNSGKGDSSSSKDDKRSEDASAPKAGAPQASAGQSADADRSPDDSPADLAPLAADAAPQDARGATRDPDRPGRRFIYRTRPVRSPDGKWTASLKEQNVYLAPTAGGDATALSQDGKTGLEYGRLEWSPDSSTLVAFRIEPGDDKEVYRIETSPRGGGRAVLHERPYALPGDKLASFELNLFTIDGKKQKKPTVDRIDLDEPALHWEPDGRHFTYLKV
ncbi:MAG TPA: DPP IV N-terminal domain-containing protein, partial [Pirellulales bacterium]|nr:DPP IV N-terminal domain-containing protein [Pirellulales bacterium]